MHETVQFMHTWVGFFVKQYCTKITTIVKNYLDSKKLSMDGWLSVVKQGHRGDTMTVYILSVIKGVQTCIHLKNRKVWSTLHTTLLHHDELITRCDMHLVYVVRRRGRLAPHQPLSVCALLPAYEGNRHLRPPGNLGHRLRRPRWID